MAGDDTKKSDDTSAEKSPDKKQDEPEAKGHVIDVSRPGSSKPSATSRPVIVGSGKLMQDPMVKSAEAEDDADAASAPSSTGKSKIIQPLSESGNDKEADEPEESEPAEAEKQAAEEGSDNPKEEDAEESAPEAAAEKTDTENKSETAIVDAVIDQATSKKNTTKQEVETTDDRIDTLIEEKKYFVSVGKTRKKRFNTIVISISIAAIIATVVVVANEYEFISLW